LDALSFLKLCAFFDETGVKISAIVKSSPFCDLCLPAVTSAS